MKRYIKILTLIVAVFACFCLLFAACANDPDAGGGNSGGGGNNGNNNADANVGGENGGDGGSGSEGSGSATSADGVLIACFSATGNTLKIAGYIGDITGGTLYEITPEQPYTQADLDYGSDCRANREQNDRSSRPAIAGEVENMESYKTIFLGYPIWWSKAPKIICTFLEAYDFAGKIIVPFCTSGDSGIEASVPDIRALASGAEWKEGRRFSSSATKGEVEGWINGLNL